MDELVVKGYYATNRKVASTTVPPGIQVEVADGN